MASVFDTYTYGGHAVCESTLMLATMSGGHFYNVVHTENLDNGSVMVIKPENYKEGDVFKAAAPTVKDKVVLLLNAPKIYEEYTKKMQEENNYFLGKGEIGRAYEVYETDRFALTAEGFSADSTPAVQKYVVVDPGKFTLKVVDDDPNATTVTNAFVGYIYGVAANGAFKVFVKRNREVEAVTVSQS